MKKKAGKPPLNGVAMTDAEKQRRAEDKKRCLNPETGVYNVKSSAWIPNTPEAKAALAELCAQLRRDAGTTFSD